MEYVTTKDKAKAWNITDRQVQLYCKQNKIPGAKKMSGHWMIPKDAEQPCMKADAPLRLLSLFSGCGGMDLGFEGGFEIFPEQHNPRIHGDWNVTVLENQNLRLPKNRFVTVFANDIKPDAQVVWERYFESNKGVYCLDSIVDLVTLYKKNGLPIFPDNIDIVTGGFPCQDFSIAGKRLGFDSIKSHTGLKLEVDEPNTHNRGTLYMWMREVIAITKPKVFVAENVKGLTNLGDAKAIIEADFASIADDGYFVFPARVLHAANYGVAQNRERVIFIGLRKNALKEGILEKLEEVERYAELDPYPSLTHSDEDIPGLLPYVTVRDVFKGLVEPNETKDIDQSKYSGAKFMGRHCQGQTEVDLDGLAPTIRSEHHGNIEFRRLSKDHGGKYLEELKDGALERRLTVRECARIQSFPDDYKFCGKGKDGVSATNGYKLIGNAVPPLMAYHIAKRLEALWDVYFKS